jgi:hypothetical protein
MDHKEALQQSVAETFENMAFLEMTPIHVNPLPLPVLRSFRQASMSVFSPVQGALVITLSPTMLRSVTANVYGVDPEETDPRMEADTLAEMLNTISGGWMRSITDVDLQYELGLPDTSSADYVDSKTAELHCIFSADGDFVEVAFFAV